MARVSLEEWQLHELFRCLDDPEYFVETFCWLEQKASAGVSETSAIIPFRLGVDAPTQEQIRIREVPEAAHFYFQRVILRHLIARRNVLTLKSRRVGCSWIASAYVAWLINFHPGVKVVMVSRNLNEAIKLLDKVKFILNNLAYHDSDDIHQATSALWLRGTIHVDSTQKFSIGWRNDAGEMVQFSTVESVTTTDDSARGDDCTFLVFDELAFYEHPDETWSSAQKTLARGGHWMAVSTPNGIGDVFHRLCALGDLYEQRRMDEPLDYVYLKIHWSEAGITREQVNRTNVGSSQELADQEWEWKFIAPGTVVFDPTHLAACYKPLDMYPEVAAELALYHEFVLKGEARYYSGADTIKGNVKARQTQKDFNSFTAMTASGIQAAHYYDQSSIAKWAGQNIDNPAGGRTEVVGILSRLHEEYPGFLIIEDEGPGLTAVNNHITPKKTGTRMEPSSMKSQFKQGIIERLIIKVESHEITITDLFTYQCMMVFQRGATPGTYGAPKGFFDDPVISMALAEEARDREKGLHFNFGRRLSEPIEGEYRRVGSSAPERTSVGPKILPIQVRDDIQSAVVPIYRRLPGPDLDRLPDLTYHIKQLGQRSPGERNGRR